ncbi:MAG: hypothetical protein KDA97_10770, partial [Acidimicrobiales bacterium]|nr:hypothetical protein [Acidimicrobiales bacterium]
GAAAPHPRLLMDPGTGPDLAAKVAVEPLRSVFVAMVARADAYDDRPLGDPGIVVQRDLTRAAKIRAFQYAIDRTV